MLMTVGIGSCTRFVFATCMKPDLRFPLDRYDMRRRDMGWWNRYCARWTARMLWKSGAMSFQFGGFDGALKKNYFLVNASVFQLMHWILRVAGYDCCPADVMKRCGANPDSKSVPEGCLEIFAEADM